MAKPYVSQYPSARILCWHPSRNMMPQVVLAAVFFALFYATQARALRVTFFNQKDFKGDSYTFYGGVREVGSDCTPCVKVRQASWWESYKSSGDSMVLYDSPDCSGRSSNKLPATSGDLWSIAFNSGKELKRAGRAMQFIPAASIESFRLCTVPEDRQ